MILTNFRNPWATKRKHSTTLSAWQGFVRERFHNGGATDGYVAGGRIPAFYPKEKRWIWAAACWTPSGPRMEPRV